MFTKIMTLDQFRSTLTDLEPPADASPALRAMWEDARGNWDKAHAIAQEIEDATGSWVHAYLHRKEGDLSNARFWYARAAKPSAHDDLESEWTRIVEALL